MVCPDAGSKERIDSERNQGRAPDMGWLDHDRLGFNYRLDDLSCALGLAQLERLDDLLAARSRVAAWYAEGLAGAGGARAPLSRPAAATGGAGSCTWCSFRRESTATRPSSSCASAGVDSKPYLPAIHLLSFYRERFGHREGEFPVCEDVARRSLALPFYPELSESGVERVVRRCWRQVLSRRRRRT